jgi:hypothetical protein
MSLAGTPADSNRPTAWASWKSSSALIGRPRRAVFSQTALSQSNGCGITGRTVSPCRARHSAFTRRSSFGSRLQTSLIRREASSHHEAPKGAVGSPHLVQRPVPSSGGGTRISSSPQFEHRNSRESIWGTSRTARSRCRGASVAILTCSPASGGRHTIAVDSVCSFTVLFIAIVPTSASCLSRYNGLDG